MATQIADFVSSLNSIWLGYRFVAIFYPDNASFSTIKDAVAMNSIGITSVDFPKVDVRRLKVPSLSSRDYSVPAGVSYSPLVIKAPVVRNQALWNRIEAQVDTVRYPRKFQDSGETIIISEFGASAVTDVVPIAVWIMTGCKAISFETASADSNGGTAMPLETLTFEVKTMSRL